MGGEGEKPSGKARVIEFAETSGMHGVVKFTMGLGIFRIICWASLMIALSGICIWQMYEVFDQYFSYDTSTSIDITYSKQLTFPAVTVCNLNPVRLNDLSRLPPTNSYRAYLDSISGQSTGFAGPSYTGGSFDWNNIDATSQRTDFNTKQDAYSHYMSLSESEMLSVGSTIETMLIDCSYNGITCSPQNFIWFANPVYGNCYSFNMPDASGGSSKTANSIGPIYGLSLVMAIDQDEYVHQLAESAGIRMVIHDQNNMPFPEDEGIVVNPGAYTQVGIERKEYTRASPPWGKCQTFDTDEAATLNAYMDQLPVGYTSKGCDLTCTQRYIVQDCACINPLLPSSNTSLIGIVADSTVPYCFLSNQTVSACVDVVKQKAHSRLYNCEDECPTSCSNVRYDTTISASMWPADAKEADVLNMINNVNAGLASKLGAMAPADKTIYLSKNILKVDVFYATLDYETITTSAAYTWEEFLSDIGGTVELWLGLSIITFFEMIELIVDVMKICMLKKNVQTSPVTELEGVD